jgi:two-component sensor histidine kinase
MGHGQMRLTIRQRLFLLTAAAITPALIAFAITEVQLRQERTADIHALALRQARLASSEFDRIIDGVATLLRATATAHALGVLPPGQCQSFLEIVAAQGRHIRSITIYDPATGALECGNTGETQAWSPDLMRDAAARKNVVVGHYRRADATSAALLPVAVPFDRPEGGQLVAVAHVGLDWLGSALQARALAPGDALTIADREGVIVARQPLPERFVGTRIPPPYLDLVGADAAGTLEVVSQDGTRRVIGYVPPRLTSGLYVSAGVSTERAFAAINRASATSAAIMISGAALAFGFTWFVGQRVIQRPMLRLLAVTDAWQTGDLGARTGIPDGPGEFETLAASLDAMMSALQQRDVERQQASEQRALLARELSHRAKNTLALVQAIASQTFAGADPDLSRRFAERLIALAGSFDLLVAANWSGAGLHATIDAAVRPHRSGEGVRFSIGGPDAALPAQAVVGLSLALHELATNAAKYGALSVPEGRVTIRWTIREGPPQRIELTWSESGGPPVSPPERQGFGTKLMRRILPGNLHPEVLIRYPSEGVTAMIAFDLSDSSATA